MGKFCAKKPRIISYSARSSLRPVSLNWAAKDSDLKGKQTREVRLGHTLSPD
jgi:hypothetical protein